ncbi:hypothetical protein DFR29_1442 [Tahibacter aquaticus]|uniref:DUF6484 domain-containing protein n=1 Tax=Tahibacter aquaticus TaxID=520092 RepID=A0A4R6YEV2_9GAMM|nr:DUF6484 domain-containing protein [Tahibacter aquaticus]TDR34746.1 hypothetical protein DFR29_1442 [Tahibacter aquaticus]
MSAKLPAAAAPPEKTDAVEDATGLMQALMRRPAQESAPERIDGVLIGVLHDIDEAGSPRVLVPGYSDSPRVARACCTLAPEQAGQQCALMFEGGDPARPLIMGLLQQPVITLQTRGSTQARQDVDTLHVRAEHAIELHCGKASLRLTSNGRVELRGTTVISHATGLNRVRGASIKLN